ncbi:MAG: hypothetical protein HC898_08845 [Phycisphaerales bacterium]|nr:hypothetical protein [Phycisphaerales bacterium]
MMHNLLIQAWMLLPMLAQEGSPAPQRSWGMATFVALVLAGAALGVSFLSSRRGHRD